MVWEGWHREVSPYPDLRRVLPIFERADKGLLNELMAALPETGPALAGSELDLLRDAERIVDLDAEIADGAFELGVPE